MATVGLACDHAGFQMKEIIAGWLLSEGHTLKDYGCNSCDSVDYPDYAHALAGGIEKNECEVGVAICGSANGISMALNKHQSVRAAICWTPEIAELARLHNNANVCSLAARFTSQTDAIAMVEIFLATPFEGGRHQKRVDKIAI